MKATIKRPDGTIIKAEGSPEEIARLAGGTTNAPHVCAPCLRSHFEGWLPSGPAIYPLVPVQPFVWPTQPLPYIGDGPFPWGTTCMGVSIKAADGFIHNAGAAISAAGYVVGNASA